MFEFLTGSPWRKRSVVARRFPFCSVLVCRNTCEWIDPVFRICRRLKVFVGVLTVFALALNGFLGDAFCPDSKTSGKQSVKLPAIRQSRQAPVGFWAVNTKKQSATKRYSQTWDDSSSTWDRFGGHSTSERRYLRKVIQRPTPPCVLRCWAV